MKIETVRAYLSLMVVGTMMLVICIVTTVPVLYGLPLEPYLDLLRTYSVTSSGIVGIVLGYYFGRKSSDEAS